MGDTEYLFAAHFFFYMIVISVGLADDKVTACGVDLELIFSAAVYETGAGVFGSKVAFHIPAYGIIGKAESGIVRNRDKYISACGIGLYMLWTHSRGNGQGA